MDPKEAKNTNNAHIGVLIVVIVLIAGAFYLFREVTTIYRESKKERNPEPIIINEYIEEIVPTSE
jgi:hypothetical protein